jgi:hypothetical protein
MGRNDGANETIVLVEGASDQVALETLAARLGLDLRHERVSIVAMGGATNIRTYLARYQGHNVRLAGLCDAGEERSFRRGLELAGFGTHLDRAGLAAIGFFVCVADLEDELIRAVGADAVERVIESRGELGSFRTMQKQPAHLDRPVDAQLRRFMGTKSRRKADYARFLVDALDLSRIPGPLAGLLAYVSDRRRSGTTEARR